MNYLAGGKSMSRKNTKLNIQLNDYLGNQDYKTGYVDNTPCVVRKLPDDHWCASSLFYNHLAGYGVTINEACSELVSRINAYQKAISK